MWEAGNPEANSTLSVEHGVPASYGWVTLPTLFLSLYNGTSGSYTRTIMMEEVVVAMGYGIH